MINVKLTKTESGIGNIWGPWWIDKRLIRLLWSGEKSMKLVLFFELDFGCFYLRYIKGCSVLDVLRYFAVWEGREMGGDTPHARFVRRERERVREKSLRKIWVKNVFEYVLIFVICIDCLLWDESHVKHLSCSLVRKENLKKCSHFLNIFVQSQDTQSTCGAQSVDGSITTLLTGKETRRCWRQSLWLGLSLSPEYLYLLR